jgi:hypothetical protein
MTTTQIVTVELEDKPGTLGTVTRTLAKGGVNITGFAVCGGYGIFLTDNPKKGAQVLESEGFDTNVQSGFEVSPPNMPGQLANLTENLGNEGINITGAFGVTNFGGKGGSNEGRLYVVVNDVKKATPVFERLAGSQTATAPRGN